MTIDKVSRLFSAFQQQGSSSSSRASKEAQQQSRSSDAVSSEIESVGSESERTASADRVAALKKAVADGSYKPDMHEVAKAFIREVVF